MTCSREDRYLERHKLTNFSPLVERFCRIGTSFDQGNALGIIANSRSNSNSMYDSVRNVPGLLGHGKLQACT